MWFTALQKHVPDDALSRMSSIDWLGSMALNPLGYALVGTVSAALEPGTPSELPAAALGIASLSLLLSFSVRDLGLTTTDAT